MGLILAGLLATAAVSIAITVALVQRNGEDSSTSTSKSENSTTVGPVRISATASSTRPSIGGGPYLAANVLDGSLTTAWVEGVDGPGIGEWIQLDFDREVQVSRMRITPGYFKSGKLWAQNNRLAAATLYFSDGKSRSVSFPDRMETQNLDLNGVRTRWIRLTIDDIYGGSVDSKDSPISEIAVDFNP